ncbi:MAG TPA: nuclear transport factor 2 family protein [Gemmatimonadales bacterium]|nr:nuclear transport factor 2 family protein [Gemmatimonadales bacterium]
MPKRHIAFIVLSLATGWVPAVLAQAFAADSADVIRAMGGFHAALSAGDSAAALDLLGQDVLIAESGTIENLREYRAHHLAADIEFARAVASSRQVIGLSIVGSVAWVVSSSTTTGSFRDRPINSDGAELMILSKDSGTWRICAIHWSSRRRS